METSLHHDLKMLYAGEDAQFEVHLGRYRIDAVAGGELVEIQHASLAAIRDKVRRLLVDHRVVVVKPIVVRKVLVKLACEGGQVIERRMSPKQGRLLDVFEDLVYFTRVFPHRRLAIDVAMVDVEEWRYPGHGRRRRRRQRDHQVADQKLVTVHEVHRLRTKADLAALVGCDLPRPFHTGDLAASLGVPRWIAQKIAYCLRNMGAARQIGKRGNALLYELSNCPATRL